jgi:hypothetical protein
VSFDPPTARPVSAARLSLAIGGGNVFGVDSGRRPPTTSSTLYFTTAATSSIRRLLARRVAVRSGAIGNWMRDRRLRSGIVVAT